MYLLATIPHDDLAVHPPRLGRLVVPEHYPRIAVLEEEWRS